MPWLVLSRHFIADMSSSSNILNGLCALVSARALLVRVFWGSAASMSIAMTFSTGAVSLGSGVPSIAFVRVLCCQ